MRGRAAPATSRSWVVPSRAQHRHGVRDERHPQRRVAPSGRAAAAQIVTRVPSKRVNENPSNASR